MSGLRRWAASGAPWIWLTAAGVAASLLMVVGLVLLIAVKGLGQFWPSPVEAFVYAAPDGSHERVLGELWEREEVPRHLLVEQGFAVPEGQPFVVRSLYKVGNRDLTGRDFRWFPEVAVSGRQRPLEATVLEREEWGNFYGMPLRLEEAGRVVAQGEALWPELAARLERRHALARRIRHIEKDVIGAINYRMERLRLERRRLELDGAMTPQAEQALDEREAGLKARYAELAAELATLRRDVARDALVMRTADGTEATVPLAKIVRAYAPNRMGLWQKVAHYAEKLWEFVSDDPREANTEGGIFPAIFGTVLMVLVMSALVTPLGVVAAVYLREYARQGLLTRTIRIAVNNLAGVPSVVYGVFGLGFFVYGIGTHIDRLFFPEALPAPTFGTPGLLWASLTLALLTLPVVIVATEEGLTRIPGALREGSLALGATKAETLWRVVLPMATPAMMTGLILAIARAAGEVAPLMLVGVVKLAPSLPLDGNFPFLHLERKFMHLGFHIYDVGFQSPNVEAARPLVYATSLLLVLVIVTLNLTAIAIRNRLEAKYNVDHG